MKKLNYIILILISTSIYIESYSQAEEVFEKVVLREGDCEFEYLKKTNYLESSLESIPFLNNNKKIKYIDVNGKKHKFSCSSESLPIWCEYNWTCQTDTSLSQKYFVTRPTYCKTLTSKSNKLKIEYYLSAVVNEEKPKTCSDILYVSVTPYNGESLTSNIIIEQRTDTTNSNEKLIFHNEIEIENVLYHNVYEDHIDNHNIFYSLEKGIIMMKNSINDQILVKLD